MTRRTPNQEKALSWYAEQNNFRPQLSTHPVYYFLDENGKQHKQHIIIIVAEWEKMRKAEAAK